MQTPALYGTMKWIGYLVLLLMVSGILYAAYISFTHWAGIGV